MVLRPLLPRRARARGERQDASDAHCACGAVIFSPARRASRKLLERIVECDTVPPMKRRVAHTGLNWRVCVCVSAAQVYTRAQLRGPNMRIQPGAPSARSQSCTPTRARRPHLVWRTTLAGELPHGRVRRAKVPRTQLSKQSRGAPSPCVRACVRACVSAHPLARILSWSKPYERVRQLNQSTTALNWAWAKTPSAGPRKAEWAARSSQACNEAGRADSTAHLDATTRAALPAAPLALTSSSECADCMPRRD